MQQRKRVEQVGFEQYSSLSIAAAHLDKGDRATLEKVG
jgi:hypothetical protein